MSHPKAARLQALEEQARQADPEQLQAIAVQALEALGESLEALEEQARRAAPQPGPCAP